jgi:hypothetical protein
LPLGFLAAFFSLQWTGKLAACPTGRSASSHESTLQTA